MRINFTHVAHHVRDMALATKFYSEVCGMHDRSPLEGQKSPWFSSEGEDSNFAIVFVGGAQVPANIPRGNFSRLGFSYPGASVLKEKFKKVLEDESIHIVHPYSEQKDRKRGCFWVQDPDGYNVEHWNGNNPRPNRLSNVTIHVGDLGKSQDWYAQWAGMELFHKGQVTDSVRMKPTQFAGGVELVLCGQAFQPLNQDARNIGHLGFSVGSLEDLQSLYDRASQAGIVDIKWIEMAPPAGTLFFVRDPDGRRVEFSYGQPLGPEQ